MPDIKAKDTWLLRVVPFGLIGRTKPQHYREMLGVIWENRKEIPYAWNVLNHGVCDGCSLGPYGLRDNVLDGVHLCMTRLKLLKLNTMGALDLPVMNDVNRLRGLAPEQLPALGRLAYPMIRRKSERGFLRVSWEEALGVVAKAIHKIAPNEMAFFATSRGLTNEVYYVFQKLARVLGTNNVDLCARLCHAASVSGLKSTLGYGAPTCSLSDFIGTDLLVLFGSDLANNQPVTTQYMHYAKKAGTRIVVVNPIREYDVERDGMASVVRRAVFGAKLIDDFFQVRVGGDVAFINGVLKFVIAAGRLDQPFIDRHTAGFGELAAALAAQSWGMLEERSGVAREAMQRFAEAYGQARSAVFVYSMGLTQYEFAVDNIKAVVNLALARGMLGRDKCGIMPIRGHGGVQGGGECGSEPDKFPGGFAVSDDSARRFSNLWHHPVPSKPGLKVPDMIEAARAGRIKFLYSVGGNWLETMPDPSRVTEALGRVSMRVHQDIVLNPSMLVDADEAVILLPGQTRYEQRSGGTSTSTERRIRFTPEIPGHRVGDTLPDWEIPLLIGRKAMPNGDKLFPFNDTQAIREEMSRVMPIYQGIEKLTQEGDQLQWGGPQLYKDGFTTMPENRAMFTALDPPDCRPGEGVLSHDSPR
ncbi:MAG TPA: molybdopterin-dependent oxidoreductase [Candidatus Binatia bacterium]